MKKPDKQMLARIRAELIDSIFRNEDVMYSDLRWCDDTPDFVSMIASLYNMLHLVVTGEEYDYFFHWANKIGSWCDDDYFTKEEDANSVSD